MLFRGTKIYNAGSPWRYMSGGKIAQMRDMSDRQKKNDSLMIIAMPNELIIPATHRLFPKRGQLVSKVVTYLDKLGVRLPNT